MVLRQETIKFHSIKHMVNYFSSWQLSCTGDITNPCLVQASAQLDKGKSVYGFRVSWCVTLYHVGVQAYLFDGYKEMEREEQGKLVIVSK